MTSVSAWTRGWASTKSFDDAAESRVMLATAAAISSSDARSLFPAVVMIPVPSGLVRSRMSPGLAPDFEPGENY